LRGAGSGDQVRSIRDRLQDDDIQVRQSQGGGHVVRIAAGGTIADIAERGAELTRWCVGGRDLLWSGDGVWWDEQSPLLFPVVGWTRDSQVRVGGQTYPLGLHGFARRRHSLVEEAVSDEVRLSLRESAATLALYPFAFKLTLTYRVAAAGLVMEAVVENTGTAPMPYAFGFHPGFRWPFASLSPAGHAVVFETRERAQVPVIAPGGLISAAMRPATTRRAAVAAFAGSCSRAMPCVLSMRQAMACGFEDARGNAIAMAVENLPHLALWTRPGALICALSRGRAIAIPRASPGICSPSRP
jgi:hypothetical protein